MRRVLVVLAALGVALAMPCPAYAKGPAAATVTGPGLTAPVYLVMNPDGSLPAALADLIDGTRLWDLLSDRPGVPLSAPSGDLGARYLIAYDFGCVIPVGATECGSDAVRLEVRQEVYPFAAAGAQIYTPPDQTAYGNPLPGGWLAAGNGLPRTLGKLGVPSPGASASGGTSQVAPQKSSRHTPGAWVPVLVLTAGLLGSGGFVLAWRLRQRGRRAGPQPTPEGG